MRPTIDIRCQLSSTVYAAINSALMYEPNVKATWMRAEAAADYEISKYSDYVAFHRIKVDGTFYGDVLAQESGSYDEYLVRCEVAGATAGPKDEFDVRRAVKSRDQVYVKVEILWDGHSEYDTLCDGSW